MQAKSIFLPGKTGSPVLRSSGTHRMAVRPPEDSQNASEGAQEAGKGSESSGAHGQQGVEGTQQTILRHKDAINAL